MTRIRMSCLYHYFYTATGWAVLLFAMNADAGRGVARRVL